MMKRINKILVSVLMCSVLFSAVPFLPIHAEMVTVGPLGSSVVYSSNAIVDFERYSMPDSNDYAYWNGNATVKSPTTTVDEIKWMQAALNYCRDNKGLNLDGYLYVDGAFGPASKEATLCFQRKYGLDADGSFGPNTISRMLVVLRTCSDSEKEDTRPTTNDKNNYNAYSSPSSNDYAYWNGSSVVKSSTTTTSEIKWMQTALNFCRDNKGVNFGDYLEIDGSFGPASKNATTCFQQKFGLEVDGRFGAKTIAKMKEVLGITEEQTQDILTSHVTTAEIDAVLNRYGYRDGRHWVYNPGQSSTSYLATDTVESGYNSYKYNGAIQCMGFACFVMSQVTGVTVGKTNYGSGWKLITSYNEVGQLQVGDVVRIGPNDPNHGHSAVVYSVNGDKVMFLQVWSASEYKNAIKIVDNMASVTYGKHYNLSDMSGVFDYVLRYVG